jgi:hypothetical protein
MCTQPIRQYLYTYSGLRKWRGSCETGELGLHNYMRARGKMHHIRVSHRLLPAKRITNFNVQYVFRVSNMHQRCDS